LKDGFIPAEIALILEKIATNLADAEFSSTP